MPIDPSNPAVPPSLASKIPDFELAVRLDVPVLITAQERSDREPVARLIHQRGMRGLCPFAYFACTRDGSDELSTWRRVVAHARGGTLFVDDIGVMSETLQCALLEVLNSGTSDLRIIAGANRPIGEAESSAVLQTLYYRLNIIHLECSAARAQ